MEPVRDLTPSTVGAQHVQPVAETMGNDAAQSAMDTWIVANHGGPVNPDDPQDAWFWQHKGIADWDFASKAELNGTGSKTTETDNGSVTGAYDLKSTAEHTQDIDGKSTTVTGSGDLSYNRVRDTDAVQMKDEFSAGLNSQRTSVTDKDGEVTRTSEGNVNGKARFDKTISDGDDRVSTVWAHDGRASGSGTRTGDETTASALDGSMNSRFSRTADTGPENDRRSSKISGSAGVTGTTEGIKDERTSRVTANIGGAATGSRTTTSEDGAVLVRSGNVSGAAKAARNKDKDATTYTGDGSIEGDGQVARTTTRDNGAVVVDTLAGEGALSADLGTKGRRSGTGTGEVSASRDVTLKTDTGSLATHAGGMASGSVDLARTEDGVTRKSDAKLAVDGSRTQTTTLDDGSLAHTLSGRGHIARQANRAADGSSTSSTTGELGGDWDRTRSRTTETGTDATSIKVGGEARGGTSVNAEGVRSNTAGGSVRSTASRELKDTFEDGSTRERNVTGAAVVSADGTRTEGKNTGTGSVDLTARRTDVRRNAAGDSIADAGSAALKATGGLGDAERSLSGHLNASRDTATELEDGRLKTHVGGGATAGTTRTVVGDDGIRRVHTGALTADGSRTRTTDIEHGTIDRTLRGDAGLDRSVTVNPDGTRSTATNAKASVDRDHVTRTRTDDSRRERTLGVGGDLRGGTSTDTQGVRTTTAGATARGSYKDNTFTTLDGGSTVDRTVTGNATVGGDASRSEGKTTGTATSGVSAGLKTVRTDKDDDVTVVTTSGLDGRANVDAASDKTGKGSAALSGNRSVRRTETVGEGHTVETLTGGKAGVDGSLQRTEDGWKNGQNLNLEASRTRRETRSDETGLNTDTVKYSATGTAGRTGETGRPERDAKASLNLVRDATTTHEHTADGVSRNTESGRKTTLGGDYATATGFGVRAGQSWTDKDVVSDADGNTRESSRTADLSGGWSSKKGLFSEASANMVRDRRTDKWTDTLTRTTTRGEGKATAGAGVNRDKDGNWQANAAATASATAFADNLAWDGGDGLTASAGYEVGTAEANAKATANMTSDQVSIKGSAGAKVTLIGGNAKAEVPAFTWKLLGEPVRIKITAALSASVLAEANGEVELDVSKGENIGVTVGGGGRAFAGAKAGVEVGAHIQWMRHTDYAPLIMDFLDDMPGFGWAVDDVPIDLWKQVASVLIGTGTSDLLIGKAGLHGSAGIGGEANFGLSLRGGRVKMNGDLNGAIGLGGGATTSLDFDAVDGVRFGGVIAMRGVEWIKSHIGGAASWSNQIIDEAQRRVDAYMEDKKSKGGWGGMWAGAVDWVGDDLFDLW